jgi:hypothetical protein
MPSAEELTECCDELLEYWLNYDAMGRDLEIDGETVEYVCLSLLGYCSVTVLLL